MKELLTLQGGYPREMDYLLNLQTELYAMSNGIFAGLGMDLILAGCIVNDNGNGTVNISGGLVYIAGEILRFDGANNVAADGSKALAKGAYIASDQKTFGDGSQKNVYREAKAVVVNAAGTISEIKIKTMLYDLKHFIQDAMQSFDAKGTIKDIYDLDGTFLANFDSSGLGVTQRWTGWALDNGNNGTPGSSGKMIIAAGIYTEPGTGEQTVYHAGDTGGSRTKKITADQVPTPAGLINELDGPHRKAADGSGDPLYYVKSQKGAAVAVNAVNLMNPFNAAYRVVKIV